MNSPFMGGTHLPDVTVITPVFNRQKKLLFFTASREHLTDIGAIPPFSQKIQEEGIIIENFKIINKGKFKGGDGVIRKIKFLDNMTVGILSSQRKIPPYGLNRGLPGKTGLNYLIRADGTYQSLQGCDQVEVAKGDTIIIETPGGGGFDSVAK